MISAPTETSQNYTAVELWRESLRVETNRAERTTSPNETRRIPTSIRTVFMTSPKNTDCCAMTQVCIRHRIDF